MAEKPTAENAPEPAPEAAKPPKAEKKKAVKKEDAKAKAPAAPKKGDYGPDFKYIVRLASTDLDGTKQIQVALTRIKGVGARVGTILSSKAQVNPRELIGNLTDAQVETLQGLLDGAAEHLPPWAVNRPYDVASGADLHAVGAEVQGLFRDDMNRLKKIRSYRGIRHEAGLPVRGQRTRSNGRTGLTVGVQRAKAQEKAAAEKKKEDA